MVNEIAPGREGIDRNGFTQLMTGIMVEKLLSVEDNMEKTRQLFREADTDYSGFLDADEIFTVLYKQGVDL